MEQNKHQIFNLFPLTIYKTKLGISEEARQFLIDEIYSHEKQSKNINYKNANSSWTGDTQGFEYLFLNKKFSKLFKSISLKIKEYTAIIGVLNDQVDFYYQRSWATISRKSESIKPHKHLQSHISFAYYLQKDKNSGKIQFHNDKSHNEIAPGIFTSLTLSKIVTPNIYNVSTVRLDTDVDDIIIFPSKTMHSVLPSVSAGSKDRISISADVSMIIKNSTNSETLLTPVDKWMKF